MEIIAAVIVGLMLGGVAVSGWTLFKTRDPDPIKENERGYNEAKEMHNRGVPVWSIEGYGKTVRAMDAQTPFDEGMQRYVDEALKRP